MSFDSRVFRHPKSGFVLDLSHAPDTGTVVLGPALAAMSALEAGAIANESEGRQVGHYWLRSPQTAPNAHVCDAIQAVHAQVAALEKLDVNTDTVLLVGIGGSTLGPQLAYSALSAHPPTRRLIVLDTVDPAGMRFLLRSVNPHRTIVIVASKSGTTAETRMALGWVERHWAEAGVCFADSAIAITSPGSPLEALARTWRSTFPVWDWVGGRTSLMSAIGLVPMALCGIDWRALLAGAAEMDAWTRNPAKTNPAAQLAATWWVAGAGQGGRALVLEPYIDRFAGLARTIQQLLMESLGKSTTRGGEPTNQGLTVYGNKGSADQHALMQQLLSGRDDALVHFVYTDASVDSSPFAHAAGDLQFSLMEGTRTALHRAHRSTVTIQLPNADARALGALLALFERAVGIYAELADINAYDQPDVEHGKRAAREHLQAIEKVKAALSAKPMTAVEIAQNVNLEPGRTWRILCHLCTTHRAQSNIGKCPSDDSFFEVR
jgi:glucose-6-phosphate isomerase